MNTNTSTPYSMESNNFIFVTTIIIITQNIEYNVMEHK